MDERRNGTRRLYRARPEGLAELKAFLDGFWDDAARGAQTRSRTRGEGESMERTTERLEVQRELEIAASPETVWELLVDPEKAPTWWGRAATLDPRPGGEFRIEVIPGQRRERRVRRGRAAAPARLHLGLGGRGRRARTRAAGVEHGRDRARARRERDDASAHPPRPADRRARPRATAAAGTTTSAGSSSGPQAATRARPVARGAVTAWTNGPAREGRSSTTVEVNGEGEMTMGEVRAGIQGRRHGGDRGGAKAAMEAWGAWFGGLGDAVVDMGNPFGRLGGGVRGRLERCRRLGPDRLLDPVGREPRRRGRARRAAARSSARAAASTSTRRSSDVGGGGQAGLDAGLPAPPLAVADVAHELDDGGGGDRHVLHADPLPERVEVVPAGEDVRGRQADARSGASRRCRRGSRSSLGSRPARRVASSAARDHVRDCGRATSRMLRY